MRLTDVQTITALLSALAIEGSPSVDSCCAFEVVVTSKDTKGSTATWVLIMARVEGLGF